MFAKATNLDTGDLCFSNIQSIPHSAKSPMEAFFCVVVKVFMSPLFSCKKECARDKKKVISVKGGRYFLELKILPWEVESAALRVSCRDRSRRQFARRANMRNREVIRIEEREFRGKWRQRMWKRKRWGARVFPRYRRETEKVEENMQGSSWESRTEVVKRMVESWGERSWSRRTEVVKSMRRIESLGGRLEVEL